MESRLINRSGSEMIESIKISDWSGLTNLFAINEPSIDFLMYLENAVLRVTQLPRISLVQNLKQTDV
jgi:hypothetical protein